MDERTETSIHICMPETIASFLAHEQENGASDACLRQRRNHLFSLYDWLPPGKVVTYDALRQWRQILHTRGYANVTVGNYIKNVNRYLAFVGRSDLRFRQGRAKDLRGKQFGYLTAIESLGKKQRNDILWLCRCRCGQEIVLPATRLLTGNTASCGCLLKEHLSKVNQYIDHTSLRSALREQVRSANAASGYTGVVSKGGKWVAYINYKRKRYFLGSYTNLDDAVKARANAKELVRQDAQKLAEKYESLIQTRLHSGEESEKCAIGEEKCK